jgi:HSP20 family protein
MPGNIQRQSPENSVPSVPRQHPLMMLRDEVDRLFDSFFPSPMGRHGLFEMDPLRRMGLFGRSGDVMPDVDIKETADKLEICAELPGMDEKNVDVAVRDRVLTISGEKKSETKDEGTNYHLSERTYGRFVRSFQLPDSADEDQIAADFSKGVLTVTVPKRPGATQAEKKISVQVH